jgi:hypothetical protein
VEAIRKARAEEDQVRERLSRLEEAAAVASGGTSGTGNAARTGTNGATASGAADPTAKKTEDGSALGRIFSSDGDMVEEHELGGKRRSALEILEEAKKGKMLKEVDHTKVQYIPFRKNLYIVPRALSRLTEAEVIEKREDLQIKVRGKACPVPVDTWEQCGLSDRVLETVHFLQLKEPFPIQKQAIPAIMCGRDVIGVAKTGSGKTLAFLLPMLRHILDQPPLMDGEGPIGLIMAPARELANQIFHEAKKFTKPLGLRVTCIYGTFGLCGCLPASLICTCGAAFHLMSVGCASSAARKRYCKLAHTLLICICVCHRRRRGGRADRRPEARVRDRGVHAGPHDRHPLYASGQAGLSQARDDGGDGRGGPHVRHGL